MGPHACFAIVVATVVALGFVALSQLGEVATGEEKIATTNLPSVELAGELVSLATQIRRQEARHLLSSENIDMDAREADIAGIRKQLANLEPAAVKLFDSDFERKTWAGFISHRDSWYAEWEKLRPLSRKSSESQAAADIAA